MLYVFAPPRQIACASLGMVAFVGVALSAASVSAQDAAPEFVGLGVGAAPDFFGSDDIEAVPFVFGRFNFGQTRLELDGLSGRVDVANSGSIGFGPAFRYRFGRDDVENAQVNALADIDDAVEIGGFVRYAQPAGWTPGDRFSLQLDILTDVSDSHDGTIASLTASYAYRPAPRLGLTFAASTTYGSENFVDTYFSVTTADSVASGLTEFSAGGGFTDVGLSAFATYQINDNWGLVGTLSARRLVEDAADSPIVRDAGSETQVFAGFGVTYNF
ncbi:MAG: MipA/OmpV family protein [Pseudomonadota bacterium]